MDFLPKFEVCPFCDSPMKLVKNEMRQGRTWAEALPIPGSKMWQCVNKETCGHSYVPDWDTYFESKGK